VNKPSAFEIRLPLAIPTHYDNHLVRTLTSMAGQFANETAYQQLLASDNPVLYEVYEIRRPEVAGELLHGISIVHPGKVGDEYFMTKGHFHTIRDTAEIYYCLKGQGIMVMENSAGDWGVEELHPGCVLYVTPGWAHRSVNTDSQEDLVTFFVYPGHAGHDYATIEQKGFRKLVLEVGGKPQVVDNPRWQDSGDSG
jgi:glucose-6-phosphate isomerase